VEPWKLVPFAVLAAFKEVRMNSKNMAARFLAFTYFLNSGKSRINTPAEAGQLAREGWKSFMPLVDENLGNLLAAARPVRARSCVGVGN
jgi:hypothetical protein